MKSAFRFDRQIRFLPSRGMLISVSYVALGLLAGLQKSYAQSTAQQGAGAPSLPPVTVTAPEEKRRASTPSTRSSSVGQKRRAQTARRPDPVAAAPRAFAVSQDARTGTVGYYANSTSSATKTNTPILNIPQSVNVLTKEYIQDQATHSVTDLTRYVPGVAVHQGEGNRDELVIRGVDSSANFFVNGFRDDVQYYRDIYNTQSIEVLKGPSALIFGRGAGGGLVNRTLKEADGTRVYEATAQTGSWGDRRVTLDAGQAVNENVAVRLNAFYEGSDAFRDFGHLERYGINPTITLKPSEDTKVKLSYEYYHDRETADRGNPSIGTGTRFNPTSPFAPNGDLTRFFGSPLYNETHVDLQRVMGVVEHDFGNGLTVRNATMYTDFQRPYQNVYPGSSVNLGTNTFNYAAYNHLTNRQNLFNQTDFIYKTMTGPVGHTVAFGTEFGRQAGVDFRQTGIFTSTGKNSAVGNPFDPTFFGTVNFIHHPVGGNADGVATPDSYSRYRLNIESGYVQDQIDVTRWLQLIAGVRFDRFDLSALDQNLNTTRNRLDDKVSPRAGIIFKPVENVSIYGAYSISYLPSSGDQFSALNDGTLILVPQKFENTEIGAKWNINPKLLFTTAIYELNRTNQPITDPVRGSPFVLPNGASRVRGFEAGLNGYVTDAWQSSLGYAYTDARIARDLSATVLAGNRVQLVPYNQFAWWNKYQFNPTWAAGLGVIYFSDSFASSDDTVRLPGFVRVDAAVYARIDQNWSAQLNVENLFNTGYWASADGNNNLSPGQGRTVRVSARARF